LFGRKISHKKHPVNVSLVSNIYGAVQLSENEFACSFFMNCSKFDNKVDWRGRYETPAGKARLGETPQAQAEEAPRPPLDKRVS
ncbi:hypothetical protein CMV16_14685, partial [Peribacillus simplex]